MFYILLLFFIIHLSLQECLEKKVSITTDFVEDTLSVFPLKNDAKQLLWHVAILRQGESELKFLCSGTVIGHSHVLTAASCVVDVASDELRVVAGLTLLRSSPNTVQNPHSVFTVSRKYYPYNGEDLVNDDLAILKLVNKVTFKVPQLTTSQTTSKYSKQCYSLGWGTHNQLSDLTRCPNPSFQDSINNMLYHAEQNKSILNKILDFRNIMGLSTMFIFQLSKMLDILPAVPSFGSNYKNSQDLTCSIDEVTTIKEVRMSTKHPYKCLCRNTNKVCLYSKGIDDLAHQVDIGSPVFCRLKRPKTRSKCHQPSSSKFVLIGVITDKKTEEIHWLKYGSSINMISATNVSALTDFILAVMLDRT